VKPDFEPGLFPTHVYVYVCVRERERQFRAGLIAYSFLNVCVCVRERDDFEPGWYPTNLRQFV